MVLPYLAGIGKTLRRGIDPDATATARDPFSFARGYHTLLRAYYHSTLYNDSRLWQSYKAEYNLPRSIRGIYNPTNRAVNFFPGHVYPGAWTEDGKPLPDGTPHAIAFPSDILDDNPTLAVAALQALDWGNWRAQRNVYVREGAMLGTTFVEVIDNLERGKVYPEVVPLEHVAAISLDVSGNVKAYSIAYRTIDETTGQSYRYRRTVDRDEIAIFRDDNVVSRDDNPYGFVPAVWVRHRSTGGLFGAPVIEAVIPKIDEVNRVATSVHNYVGKLQAQPVVFFTKNDPRPTSAAAASSDPAAAAMAQTEQIPWLWAKDTEGHTGNLMQTVPIEGAGIRIDSLLAEIEADLPEITLDRELRSMAQVTGPGAERIMGDVRSRLDEAQANYDAGTIKLMQMTTAIGGWRLSTAAWGARSGVTRQQAKFAGYTLDSYAAGDLDMSLLPRPLVPTTELERLQALDVRKSVARLSDDEVRRQLGYDDATIAQINAELAAQVERETVGAF